MATIHTFTGNEVIATEVPNYLNENFKAINDEVVDLSENAITTINGEKPTNNNFNIVGFDSYWESGEAVEVGDIRVPKGRENSGLFLECVKAGTTGATQPTLDNAVLANYSHVGRIGQVRWIYNIAEKDDDEIFATGVSYSRATYSALWAYVQTKPSLLVTETEWQAKYEETGGKFVPYFSEGDGSTTFRTPLLCAYATSVADNSKIGTFREAGLPNITGFFNSDGYSTKMGGAFKHYYGGITGASGDGDGGYIDFDASRSSAIYGNSDTVTPDTMYGVWVIKAFGLIVNSENTELSNVLVNIENNNEKMSDFETKYDYVVESKYMTSNDQTWYRIWKSGWVEQGGRIESTRTGTMTLSYPYKSVYYYLSIIPTGGTANSADYIPTITEKSATSFVWYFDPTGNVNTQTATWYACGQGV